MREQGPETTRTSSSARDHALYPQLTRFYGISPSELVCMPRAILRLYAEAVPALQAEEQLLAFEASAYPHMRRSDARSVMRRRERQARKLIEVEGERHKVAGDGGVDTIALAQSVGIAVEWVGPKPDFAEGRNREDEPVIDA